MEQFLTDAKRLVHRLYSHDSAVDVLISEATNLQNKLTAMRQYHEEVVKMNEAANQRPRSTLILGSQLENQRIQNLEQENRELSLSLAEHQSALELIMNKYREQVLSMMKVNGTQLAMSTSNELQESANEVAMKEKIAEMASVMRQSAAMDESVAVKEIEMLRCLQIENDNLRELLEISGGKAPKKKYDFDQIYCNLGDTNAMIKDNRLDMQQSDSGVYGNNDTDDYLSHVSLPPKKKSKTRIYDSIENLFTKETSEGDINDDSISSIQRSPVFIANPSVENCFQAIITDIKPLEDNFDVNRDIVVDNNEEEHIYFNGNKQTNESVQDSHGNQEIDAPIESTAENYDESSSASETHPSQVNVEVLQHFEGDKQSVHNENDDNNEDIDIVEQEMMANFIQITTESSENIEHTENNEQNEEETVLGLLDDILDFDNDDDNDDDDNDGKHSDDDDDEEDDGDYVEEILEVDSSDEEDANDEFSFHTEENHTENHTENQENNLDKTILLAPNMNDSISNVDLNFINKVEKDILNNSKKNYDDDVSDVDSEVTVTEDDMNEALSGFDSILDCEDDEPHEDLD